MDWMQKAQDRDQW